MPVQQELCPKDIQSAVERIAASPQFAHAESLVRLLRYLVDRTLAGEGESLKEYTLGVDVFHRGADFDPRHDTIVRVQARTLRSRLANYYANVGQRELVRIDLAKGGYVPTFDKRQAMQRARPPRLQAGVAVEQFRHFRLRHYGLALLVILSFVAIPAAWLRLVKPRTAPTLVVLPLANLSGDPEQEYFSDGITEAITTELGRVRGLRVTSRTSAMQYKPARRDLPKIARELNVNYVLEGAVTRSGQHVRVTTQLIDAASDRHIWAESYEFDLGDVILVEGKIARAVSREIQIQLSPDMDRLLVRERRVVPEAYEAYLKARYIQNEMTDEALKRSIRFFEEAIRIKPDYAAAYAGLADSRAALSTTYLPPRATMPQAIAAADRALELDGSIAEAHVSRGRLALLYDWDWPNAEAHFRRALEINPSLAPAHTWYASYLGRMRSFEESLSETRQARSLDPVSLAATLDLAWNYLETHRYDLLTSHARKVLEIDPNFAWAHAFLGWASARSGVAADGLQHAVKAARSDDSPVILGFLGEVQAMAGQRGAAQQVLEALQKTATRRYVCPHEIGTLQAVLGQYDQAVDSLEQAYQVRSECMAFLTVDPRVDQLRSHPRFQQLLARIETRH